MFHLIFMVPRDSIDETTLATVEATVDVPESMGDFQDRLTRALTKWALESNEGAQAWKNSSQDFNIGDLSNYTDNYTLKGFLKEQGIHELTITTVSSDRTGTWSFDDVLIDKSKMYPEDSND